MDLFKRALGQEKKRISEQLKYNKDAFVQLDRFEGVDRKQTYRDVIEFQSHMEKRVQNAIRYAEESIIHHDQQLEQFVTHMMHRHLHTIAQEPEIFAGFLSCHLQLSTTSRADSSK